MWRSGSRNRRHNHLHRDSWGERESEEAPVTKDSRRRSHRSPRQLPASPMMGLAVRIELANVVAVQGPHDANPRPAPMTLLRRKRSNPEGYSLPFTQNGMDGDRHTAAQCAYGPGLSIRHRQVRALRCAQGDREADRWQRPARAALPEMQRSGSNAIAGDRRLDGRRTAASQIKS